MRQQFNKNNDRNAKRLVCRGELVILLPVPATVQWTIWLQQVSGHSVSSATDADANPLNLKQESELEQEQREDEKQNTQQARSKVKHRNTSLRDELSTDEEALDEMNRRLQEQLQDLLLALSPPAFERLLIQLLEQMGYTDLRRLHNDQHNLSPGRSSHRKHTLRGLAQLRAHLGKREDSLTVLVTAKRYNYPLSRRFVDELRGAMLRHEAQLGLLVTTGTFPPAARRAVQEDAHLPVLLMDGALLRLRLANYKMGVKQLPNGQMIVDPSFFAQLEAQATQLT